MTPRRAISEPFDLLTVRAACAAATAEPWKVAFTRPDASIAEIWHRPELRIICDAREAFLDPSADAAFIALARTALPQALDVIERLVEALERIKAVDISFSSPAIKEECETALALVKR